MSWAITLLVLVLIAAFIAYLIAVARLPSFRRPPVPTYDRFGRLFGQYENPGPLIAPGREGDPIEDRAPGVGRR